MVSALRDLANFRNPLLFSNQQNTIVPGLLIHSRASAIIERYMVALIFERKSSLSFGSCDETFHPRLTSFSNSFGSGSPKSLLNDGSDFPRRVEPFTDQWPKLTKKSTIASCPLKFGRNSPADRRLWRHRSRWKSCTQSIFWIINRRIKATMYYDLHLDKIYR
jgi:hypothetical protein